MKTLPLGILVLIVLVGSVAAFGLPLLAPPLIAALIVGGVLVRRQSTDPVVRGIAVACILAGVILFIETAIYGGYLLSALMVRTVIIRKDFGPTPP